MRLTACPCPLVAGDNTSNLITRIGAFLQRSPMELFSIGCGVPLTPVPASQQHKLALDVPFAHITQSVNGQHPLAGPLSMSMAMNLVRRCAGQQSPLSRRHTEETNQWMLQ